MKKMRLIAMAAGVALLTVTACEKSDNDSRDSIEGIYAGTLDTENKSGSVSNSSGDENDATAEVAVTSDDQIEVHWYSQHMDTTIMFNHYNHNDSVLVCFTGEDFENMYGHMPGEGHMSGGHMSDMHDGETEWMHHMADEHDEGDEHFGGFDMQHHTFSYHFEMMDGDTPYTLTFQGEKMK